MPDTYHVRITDRAISDIKSIFDYIETESPQNAATVIERILNAIDDLAFMPTRFRRVGRSRKHNSVIHVRVVRPFIVYYRVDESPRVVFILSIYHGAQQQPERFD